jgi:acyl-CoA synthetase (AMP-forming)/AMP-acid ligase II
VPEIRLQIIPDQSGTPLTGGQLDFLTAGEAGEIIVCGDHVLRGYLDGLGDAETKIPDGEKVWHRTGDAGWRDSEGRVWLLGRCAEKLPPHPAAAGLPTTALRYPFAIECALREIFPNLRMAAMTWNGERTLVVGSTTAAGEAAAIAASATEFGIGRVIYLESLPLDRRHQAKIDYPALREILRKLPNE